MIFYLCNDTLSIYQCRRASPLPTIPADVLPPESGSKGQQEETLSSLQGSNLNKQDSLWAGLYRQFSQWWQAQISAPAPGSEEKPQAKASYKPWMFPAIYCPFFQPIFLPFLPIFYFLCSHSSLFQISLQIWSSGSTAESGHLTGEPAFPPIFLLTSSFCFPPFLIYCPYDERLAKLTQQKRALQYEMTGDLSRCCPPACCVSDANEALTKVKRMKQEG